MNRPNRTLDQLGQAFGLDQSSQFHNYLTLYEEVISEIRPATIAIISGNRPIATCSLYSSFFSGSKVVGFIPAAVELDDFDSGSLGSDEEFDLVRFESIGEVWNHLASAGRPDVLIEDGTNRGRQKLEAFQRLFLMVADGGAYIIEDLHAGALGYLNDHLPETVDGFLARIVREMQVLNVPRAERRCTVEESRLAQGIRRVLFQGRAGVVWRQGRFLVKPDCDSASKILARKSPKSDYGLLDRSAERRLEFGFEVLSNRPDLSASRFPSAVRIPQCRTETAKNVVCAPRQVAVLGDVVLPCSYHQPWRVPPHNRALENAMGGFAKAGGLESIENELAGSYFHLDNEWNGHYGHFLTQDLSKLWGWACAAKLFPDLRILISPPDGRETLSDFQFELLRAFGIDGDRITVLTEPTRVERLVWATELVQNPKFVHPKARSIWRCIGDALLEGVNEEVRFPRVFVSRPPGSLRECRNSGFLEGIFERYGFKIIRPELLSLGEQVSLFRNAEVTAGYAGSGLLNQVFCVQPATRIVISSDSFTSINEYLLAALNRDRFVYFWCDAEITQPPGSWSYNAFHSAFSFDSGSDAELLENTLASL